MSTSAKQVKWHHHMDMLSPGIRGELMNLDDSIWVSSASKSFYEEAENGMIQYCTKLDKVVSIASYTDKIDPTSHCCCLYNNKIYIIDGWSGRIILFDPTTEQYTIKVKLKAR